MSGEQTREQTARQQHHRRWVPAFIPRLCLARQESGHSRLKLAAEWSDYVININICHLQSQIFRWFHFRPQTPRVSSESATTEVITTWRRRDLRRQVDTSLLRGGGALHLLQRPRRQSLSSGAVSHMSANFFSSCLDVETINTMNWGGGGGGGEKKPVLELRKILAFIHTKYAN